MESWSKIPGYSDYAVSDCGRVCSYFYKKPRILAARSNSKGYPQVDLHNGTGDRWSVGVHVLVMLAFIGPRPDGKECCHKNDIRDDNRLENLEYKTHWQNVSAARDRMSGSQQVRRTRERISS